ncbi:unnamed protein product [Chironomus riparius]|uniref:Odorant receptor n=2 Tax=Chironomus riparius TaxID=315576 RepID=A0A9N9WUT8_9DIPT|nr:unnamed protein product [Chironomus riparius]
MSKPSITPSNELKKLQDKIRWFSLFIGIDIFDPHPKPNKRSFVSGVVSLLWQALVLYTIIKDLPSLRIFTLAYVHISFFSQGLMRTINLIINPQTTSSLQASIYNFYKIHENDNDVRVILEQAIKRAKKLAYGIIIFDCVIFNSGIVLLMVFLFTGAFVILVPIHLPYLNAKELVGYLLNLSLQLALGAVGFLTFATYDATILIHGYHSLTMVQVLKLKMHNLQNDMDVNDSEQRKLVDEDNFNKKFIEIVKFHDQIKSYNAEFSNLVRIPFATAIVVNIIGIFVCINMGLKKSLSLGIGASLGLFIQLLLPFIVAIMQSFQRDRLHDEIMTFSWNRFKHTLNQKNYCHLLSLVCCHQGLRLPILGTFNMKLFMRILVIIVFPTILLMQI